MDAGTKNCEYIDTKFSCLTCGEVLYVSFSQWGNPAELQDALVVFTAKHVDRHGGDPQKVAFSVPFEGTMLACST